MTTARHLAQALAKIGATLDTQNPDPWDYLLDAPPGMVWNASHTHCYVIPFKNAMGQTWRKEALADAATVIADGVSWCDEADCDMCAEAGITR